MNGNGTWRAIAFGAVGLLMTGSVALSSWALAEIGAMNKELSDNKRSIDDLWAWVRAEQAASDKWRDSQAIYDRGVRDLMDRNARELSEDLRHASDRVNSLAVIIGRRLPVDTGPP